MEQQEVQSETTNKKPSESAILQAVRSFVSEKAKREGLAFFQRYENGAAGYTSDPTAPGSVYEKLEEFMVKNGDQSSSLISTPEKKTQVFNQIKQFRILDREMILGKTKLSSLHKGVFSMYEREYSLSASQRNTIKLNLDHSAEQTLSQLRHSPEKRKNFLNQLFRERELPEKKAVASILDELIGTKLSDEQKRIIRAEVEAGGEEWLSEQLVRDLCAVATTSDQKRQLIDSFLPNITLRDLEEMGLSDNATKNTIVTRQVESILKDHIEVMDSVPAWQKEEFRNRLVEDIVEDESMLDIPLDYLGLADTHGPKLTDAEVDAILQNPKFHKKAESILKTGWVAIEKGVDPNAETPVDPASPRETLSEIDRQHLKKKLKDVENSTLNKKGTSKIAGIDAIYVWEQLDGSGEKLHLTGSYLDEDGEEQSISIRFGKWGKKKNVFVTELETIHDNGVIEKQEVSINDLGWFVRGLKEGKIMSPLQYNTEVRTKKAIDVIDDNAVQSIEELTARLDLCDSSGKGIDIKPGMSFTIGSPGKESFNVATITHVGGNSITVRNTIGTEEVLHFTRFAYAFEKFEGKRLSVSPSTPEGFLLSKKNDYEGIEYDKKGERFVNSKLKDDKDHKGIRYFVGKDNEGIEVDWIKNGRVRFRCFEKFEKPVYKQNADPTGAKAKFGEYIERPIETLYLATESIQAKPYELPTITDIPDTPYEKTGWAKFLLGWPSFVDIKKSFSNITEHVKDALKHHNEAHAAKIALKTVTALGFSDEVVAEFRGRVNNEGKWRLTKLIEKLNENYTSPERRKIVLKYLLDRSSDTEKVVACICAILGKHGNLYPGDPLSEYEGKWLYFDRLPGSKEEKQKFLLEKGNIQEEKAIFLWLMELAKTNRVNSFYWLQCKKAWEGWMSEIESGGKEAETKKTAGERVDYAMSKFPEYAHVTGALEKIYEKVDPNGNFSDRMKLPVILALSDVPDFMHDSLPQKFTSLYKKWAFYPPFLFIQEPSKRAVFRNVVRKLCANNGDMAKAFAELEKQMKEGNTKDDTIPKAIGKFWDKYGKTLCKKLAITTEDPEIFLKKDEDPDFGAYYETVKSTLGEGVEFKDPELDSGAMSKGGINWILINPKEYMKKIKYNTGPGGIQEGISEFVFGSIGDQLTAIRNYGDTSAQSDAERRKLFKEVHRAYFQRMYSPSGMSPDHWKPEKETGVPKILSNDIVTRFHKFGFDVLEGDKSHGISVLENDALYESTWLDRDYRRFMSGQGVNRVMNTTSARLNDVLGLINRTKTPANDANIRQAA